MYSYLWSLLPGGPVLKSVIVVVVLVGVFFLLMNVVFPWLSTLMPYTDVAV